MIDTDALEEGVMRGRRVAYIALTLTAMLLLILATGVVRAFLAGAPVYALAGVVLAGLVIALAAGVGQQYKRQRREPLY